MSTSSKTSTTKSPGELRGLSDSGGLRRVCIIGAGSSGLTVAKNLKQAGIPFDCLEAQPELGGNWVYGSPVSSVCRSTHLISSKALTEYTDFPMPASYPEFPSHQLVLDYFCSYADHFQLRDDIQFSTAVTRAQRNTNGGWKITTSDGQSRHYSAVVIANGHNWDPRLPDLPGHFDGLQLHSSEYKTPDLLAGKRVLVVGAGNSGCDIAVESAQHAAATHISMRRGYHFLPKFFRGQPVDYIGERLLRWRLPLSLRRRLAAGMTYLVLGSAQSLGMPRPDHRLFETHPIINSQLIYHVRHGDITIRPNLAELCGDSVRFTDGTQRRLDVIIYATGFRITIPFIDRAELNWQDERPELYLNVFHPERDDLFIAGLIQPDSGQWGLVDRQAQLITAYLTGLAQGRPAAQKFRKLKRSTSARVNAGIHYVDSPRHLLEVEHFSYRRTLDRLIRQLNR